MIAAYYRLSQADEITNGKEESSSIIHQRSMIRAFIAEHADLSAMPLTEFTDDGFSGTSTDRPAFQQMLDGVKRGTVTCIIVKDFSRFARNYIEAGDYIERIFPFLGVRFIAVTDGYDSANLCNADSQNMEMIIKNVINAAYSRDLSAKICASNQVKRNQQLYLGGLRPYGFLPDPEDCHKLILDPVASEYVKRIFSLAADGINPSAIASILQNEHIPTPSAYSKQRGAMKQQAKSWKDGADHWDVQKVRYILQNEKYKGAFVAQKRIQAAPCSKHIVKNASDKVVAIENAHEAIVSAEVFEAAQRVLRTQTEPRKRTQRNYPLKGKVICGGCGRNMSWDERLGKYGAYRCRNVTVDGNANCVRKRVATEDLLDLICGVFGSQYDLLRNATEIVKKKEKEYLRQKSVLEQKQNEIAEQKRLLSVQKVKDYEDYAEGRMDKADFLVCKKQFDVEYQNMETTAQEVRKALNDLIQQGKPCCEMLERVTEVTSKSESTELFGVALDEFVERVIVYNDNRIEIVWRFEDEIATCLQEN